MRWAHVVQALVAVVLLIPQLSLADSWLYAKHSEQAFPEALSSLQERLAAHGFKLLRIQHMDRGLKSIGVEAKSYKVLYVMPALTGEIPPRLVAALPLTVLAYEDEDGDGRMATLGASVALSMDIPPDGQLQLVAADTELALVLAEMK